MVERDYALQPPQPSFDGEPAYEYPPDALPPNRPVGALQVRRNAYWAVMTNDKTIQFAPPTNIEDEDWVLVLDDAAKNYPAPGTRK